MSKGQNRYYMRRLERQKGPVWYATVSLGRDPKTGKYRQKHLSAPTRKALEGKIADVLSRHHRGESVFDSAIPVARFLDEWLAAIASTVKPATLRSYRDYADRYLIPAFGQLSLSRLTPLHVQQLITELLRQGLSPTTVRHTYAVLRTALNKAVKWGLLQRNVCDAVDPPRRATPEMQYWTTEDARRVLGVLDGQPLGPLFRLALTTGMRRGELLGLRWGDVDLDRRRISVQHALVRGSGNTWETSTPKTHRSRRSIALDRNDVDVMRRHRAHQRERRLAAGSAWQADPDYVFTDDAGRPISATTLSRALAAITALADVPRIRFHDLRHTSATLMLAAGEHPKIVSERLGHSSIAMTLDRYSHVSGSMQEAAADRLGRFLDETG